MCMCVCADACRCLRDEAHCSAWPFPTDLELVISLEHVQVKVEVCRAVRAAHVQSFPKKQIDIYAQGRS